MFDNQNSEDKRVNLSQAALDNDVDLSPIEEVNITNVEWVA